MSYSGLPRDIKECDAAIANVGLSYSCFFTAPWDPRRAQQRSQEQLDLAQRPCPQALALLSLGLRAESQA